MSKSKAVKVVRSRQNLTKVIKDAIETLGTTLEYAPPNRSGRWEIEMRVSIKEIGETGKEEGIFHYFEATTKNVVAEKRKKVRR